MASPIPIMASPKTLATPQGKGSSNKLLGAEELPPIAGPEARRIQKAYLYGQIAHAAKMAVWWSMFGPLLLAAAPGTPGIIGYARVAFNLALVILSPFAGALAPRVSIRTTLASSTAIRGVIWGVLIPGAWWLSSQGTLSTSGVVVALMVLNFLDGTQVALGNCVDIDCGGLDMLSQQHSLHIDDSLRNRFNAIWQQFFDASFIVVNPAIAAVLYYMTSSGVTTNSEPEAILLGGVAVMFILFSVVSLICYCRVPGAGALESGGVKMGMVVRDVAAGLRIVAGNVPIAARLFFLGLETALEDAMVSVILAEVALSSGIFVNKDDYALGNLWVVSIVGFGKIGGVCAGQLVKNWVPPESRTSSKWRTLFVSIFLSTLAMALFPVALIVNRGGNQWLARALIFLASILFFFFSTAPKIGFQTMLQSLVSENQAPQVFGFVAFAVTLLDGLIILLISQVFMWAKDFENALWIVVAIYFAHGLIELVVGPSLILRD